MKRSDFIRDFIAKAPGPVIDRKTAAAMTGGLKCAGHLANRDSQGTGCKARVRAGRRTGYTVTTVDGVPGFAEWLADELQLVD